MSEFDSVSTPDDVLKLAQQRTGQTDIDSDSWRAGLEALLDEINTSTSFTQHGRDHIINDAVNALARRLQVHDYIQRHPEVLDTPVERPIFTLGMPRTGTTVISYLLDQDPARRSLLHWECVHPVPPATTATLRTDPRCLALLEEQRQMLAFVKEAKMPLPHWEDADGPTECMFIHNQDFKGLSWDSYLSSSRYAEWLINEADMTSTYEYQKRYLQILQSHAPGTWNLKMPSHSVHVDALLSVFPDARLIWAHRDPYKATGSLCNLWKLPKSMVMKPDVMNLADMGRNAVRQMQAHVERPLRARERIGDDRFYHMYYHDMMTAPMDVMRRIYDWAGDELKPDTEARMEKWLDEHPQNRFAPNAYSLDQYGLTIEGLQPIFAEYLATFDIELEGTA
ncbi:sulfotransferase family protein [Mycolicibacterium fluoranthenivorans]|uniref:Sulfotransferase family protein n=1 Tax=Mycolicibacterium fluoranthenivorans TaxID=258505 RepID=A0A1G4WYH4_9MYCO|nr:sulfotransferase [Mycolicibacterium fluoranthenivorans]SCX32399.1 Sulfotransferase family protein [Mycolicibacterium fluoranthenivorans]